MEIDMASPFKSEVFRPIAVLLIPGLIACLPYTLVAGAYFPNIADYRDQHEIAYFAIVTLIVIGIGFVIEDVGTELELLIDNQLLRGDHKDLYEVWYHYLTLPLIPEPVGQRYLRSVVLRLKFELSMAAALMICYVGLVWLSIVRAMFSACALAFIGIAFIALALFLGWQAHKGAAVLANVRRVLSGKPAIL